MARLVVLNMRDEDNQLGCRGFISNAIHIRSSSDLKGITRCGSEDGNRTKTPGAVSIILRG